MLDSDWSKVLWQSADRKINTETRLHETFQCKIVHLIKNKNLPATFKTSMSILSVGMQIRASIPRTLFISSPLGTGS